MSKKNLHQTPSLTSPPFFRHHLELDIFYINEYLWKQLGQTRKFRNTKEIGSTFFGCCAKFHSLKIKNIDLKRIQCKTFDP